MNDSVSKSWFAVFNNPAEHGYEGTPEEVCNRLRDEWTIENTTRSGAWCYCISAEGLHHIHMVLEDVKPMRFSAIKGSYAKGMHFEATKGTKRQAEAYINKEGVFAEKGETIEYKCIYGEIRGRQGKRSDLVDYYERLEAGETPNDILNDSPKAYIHLSVLKNMFFDIKSKKTPMVRDVRVIWHIGDTGTGKSFERVKLAEKIGEENIYYVSTYNSGCFDRYNGESVLWLDDFRGQFTFDSMLRFLDCYKADIPARYTNLTALWTEVHITSPLTPREVYSQSDFQFADRIEQLLRRITSICYHYKTCYNEYCCLYFKSDSLRSYMEREVKKARSFMESFVPLLTESDYESVGDSPTGERPHSDKELPND